MATRRIVGIVLIVIGIMAFGWGGIFWNDTDTLVKAGPVDITKTERKGIALPRVLGALSLVGGIVLLAVPDRRRV